MTNDEVVELATKYAQGFCRDYQVPPQEQEDYIQEAALGTMEYVVGKAQVTKALIHTVVRGVLLNYYKRERNDGIGSYKVDSYEHVSLASPVAGGAVDEEGEPVTYGDLLVYDEPPEGYGNPADELEREVDAERLRLAVKSLSASDQEFVEVALLSGLTQEAAAEKLGVSQPAVHRRTKTIVKRLQSILL